MENSTRHLLYGVGQTPNIVAVEPIKKENGVYTTFVRSDEHTVLTSNFVHTSFCYATSNVKVPNLADVKVIELNGSLKYNRRIECINQPRLNQVLQTLDQNELYKVSNGEQPYITTGETLFKEMQFDDVKRFYFDIETLTTKGYQFPNPNRKGDVITIIVVLITYQKQEHFILFRLDEYESERDMLRDFMALILKSDPDVMIGHNCFNFDLPYIKSRCELHGLELRIGRNGSTPYTYQTSMSFADKKADYTNWHVYGRHVLDTMYMAMKVDVVKRDLPSYQLKELAIYLGVASEDRHYLEGSRISAAWLNEDPEYDRNHLLLYAKDDAYETRALDKAFGQSFFYSSQFLPCSYQDAFRLGSGGRITGLFLREYYRQNHSIPTPEPAREYGGGFSGYHKSGHIMRRAIGIDIESMYPTLGEELALQPKNDELKIYQPMLKLLKKVRLDTKMKKSDMLKAGQKEAYERYDAQDGAFKIYLNTMSYGSLADGFNPFNDFDCAETITKNGRRVLKFMMFSIQSHGGEICKWDTDGILAILPDDYVTNDVGFLRLIQEDLTGALDTGLYSGFYDELLTEYE